MPPVQSPHNPTPSQQAQEAEAVARQAAGAEPQLAGALDVIEDGAPADPGAPARTPVPEAEQRPAPPVKSAFDSKRADIVARFRTSRTDDADDARDDISDFARSGMPPEFEPPAPVVEPEPEPAAAPEPEPAARPQMVKVKVHGVEKEVPLEEALGKAQIAYASENILDEVKALKRELGDALRGNQQPPRGQADQTQVRPNGAQTTEGQPSTEPAAGDPNTTEDPLVKLIETLQFGDPNEARELLQQTIAVEATRAVTANMQTARLRDESARSQKVLVDFLARYPEIANDPKARAVIEYNVYEQQLADFKALGIDPNQFKTAHGGPPTPGDIAQAHLWYRGEGYRVQTPTEMTEKALKEYEDGDQATRTHGRYGKSGTTSRPNSRTSRPPAGRPATTQPNRSPQGRRRTDPRSTAGQVVDRRRHGG